MVLVQINHPPSAGYYSIRLPKKKHTTYAEEEELADRQVHIKSIMTTRINVEVCEEIISAKEREMEAEDCSARNTKAYDKDKSAAVITVITADALILILLILYYYCN